MNILVINSGSSSIKYQLIQMPDEHIICSGLVERIGLDNAQIHYKTANNSIKNVTDVPNHKVGLEKVSELLMDSKVGVIKNESEIHAVGHRVVHGGSTFSKTTIINQSVKDKIKQLFDLAPLHNPPNYEGIEVSETIFTSATQIAVFDTAFHQTIPIEAYKYAIPNEFLVDKKIRVYGFHGTSHKYVSEKAREVLPNRASKLITIHLGNGCSITAVKDGKSMDHSLGFGPMNGLIMGTRSGDIDQSVIFYLVNALRYTLEEVNTLLQKKSGLQGLTGFSDLRDIEAEAANGNKDCQLALLMFAYRVKKYIGSYASVLNGLDTIVFTAGVGENSILLRKMICEDLDYLGIELDLDKNNVKAREIIDISSIKSKVKVLVIPTNEEIEIAKQSFHLINP
ncbi:MAG: acetate kinase [Flavobacteriales bacterium]|nr:acetate kinase [Flavobacteriales bacterium]PIV94877.1 MAG: acetate kinase [Flavobacteriaceae bacterium CG17_big_fil_post_rev_8_21_14_2_50_33_15]PIY11055.1 MAG: acetate kinase [Flavobacteriaceae bacterium CG_4_10_14_3_um_filter_33_47]PJB17345.1 MAG: acetate kinase [Flavobacteriaceae bacterium CG_4_9_14_3_um_filter_33_16]NCP53066.1 acetate kinase [Flavobacteriales bacterium]